MPTTVPIPIDFRTPGLSALAGNSFWTPKALTALDLDTWEFVKDVDGKVFGIVEYLPTLDATPNARVLLSLGANAATGVTRLSVLTKAIANAQSFNPASLTAIASQDISVPGTARTRFDATFTVATEVVAGGKMLYVCVFHEGAHTNDTLAVNTELYGGVLLVDVP
jgi:hypothetical protein